jgi:hypothetical protein
MLWHFFLTRFKYKISQDISNFGDTPQPSNSSFSITATSVEGETGHPVQVAQEGAGVRGVVFLRGLV